MNSHLTARLFSKSSIVLNRTSIYRIFFTERDYSPSIIFCIFFRVGCHRNGAPQGARKIRNGSSRREEVREEKAQQPNSSSSHASVCVFPARYTTPPKKSKCAVRFYPVVSVSLPKIFYNFAHDPCLPDQIKHIPEASLHFTYRK